MIETTSVCRCIFQKEQRNLAVSWAETAALRDESLHLRDKVLQLVGCVFLPFSNSLRYGFVAVTQLAHGRRSPEQQQLTVSGHLSKLARFFWKATNF